MIKNIEEHIEWAEDTRVLDVVLDKDYLVIVIDDWAGGPSNKPLKLLKLYKVENAQKIATKWKKELAGETFEGCGPNEFIIKKIKNGFEVRSNFHHPYIKDLKAICKSYEYNKNGVNAYKQRVVKKGKIEDQEKVKKEIEARKKYFVPADIVSDSKKQRFRRLLEIEKANNDLIFVIENNPYSGFEHFGILKLNNPKAEKEVTDNFKTRKKFEYAECFEIKYLEMEKTNTGYQLKIKFKMNPFTNSPKGIKYLAEEISTPCKSY